MSTYLHLYTTRPPGSCFLRGAFGLALYDALSCMMVAEMHFAIPGVHEEWFGLDIDGLNNYSTNEFVCETR
jgi:hypothetical protein